MINYFRQAAAGHWCSCRAGKKLTPVLGSVCIALSLWFCLAAVAAEVAKPSEDTSLAEPVPAANMMELMIGQEAKPLEPNTMMRSISRKAKRNAAQSFMALNPLSLRDMVNLMTYKIKADDELEFEEVVESIELRANFLNFKAVGHNTPWKVMEGITGKPVPKVEIFSFCDVMTMRAIMDYSPEFVAFLPCRVSVLEDSAGDIWLVTMEWDVEWLDTSANPDKIPDELRTQAITIRDNIHSIMQAGATGDL